MKALVVVALALVAGPARAAPDDVSLALAACVEQVTPREPLLRLLRVELTATLGRSITLDGGDEAGVRVRIDCGEGRDQLAVRIERRQPPGAYQGSIDLARLPAGMRPRTVALAIAEHLRWLDEPEDTSPPAASPVAASPVAPSPVAASPAPLLPPSAIELAPLVIERNPTTLRRARNWTLGLGVSSLALTVIGAPILGSGRLYRPPDTTMVAGGAVVVALALTSLGGAAVSLGYWLRERRRPAHE
jgi:hypothetical protein